MEKVMSMEINRIKVQNGRCIIEDEQAKQNQYLDKKEQAKEVFSSTVLY